MKQFLDFLPLIVFFAFYKLYDIYVASGALIAQTVAGKATRDTLFLTHFGIQMLPAAMIGAALVSSIAVLGISRLLTRHGPARVVPASFALGGSLFLGELWRVYGGPAGTIRTSSANFVFSSATARPTAA